MTTTGTKLLLLACLAASSATATTYDAVSGFSSSNPSGPWSYGSGVTGTSFTPSTVYTATGCDGIAGVSCWQPPTTVDNVPQITVNNSGSPANFATVTLPIGVLLMHPGQSTDSIVTWTAPTAGSYDISGFFELLDVSPTGIVGSIFKGTTLLYTTGALTGPPAQQSSFTPGGKDTFSLVESLTAGEVLSFGVNNDGNFLNDSTGFDATIAPASSPVTTPEPTSVFLLIIGAAAVCVMNREKLMPKVSRS